MRKFLKLFLLSFLVVFSTGGVVHAQDVRPLDENEQLIQVQSDQVQQKATLLESTNQQLIDLQNKKETLAQQLADAQKDIADLKQKLADKKAAQEAEAARLAEVKAKFVHVIKYAAGSEGNLYAPGNCTWYVKSRRPDLPNNLGNANTWYSMAASEGYEVGSAPKKGAVGTTTRGWAGHVVYVEGLNPDGTITISEMNYAGLYSTRTRTADASEFVYIYELN